MECFENVCMVILGATLLFALIGAIAALVAVMIRIFNK